MTDPTMDDAEEEALFARLKRGLALVRRDASLAQTDGAVAPAGPDPETTAALTRVEASLRTLASNVEALARRADGVDTAIETRVETTVARTTAGLRAEIERLSTAIAALSAPAEVARPEPVRVTPPARPIPERVSPMAAPPRRFGVARGFLTVLIVLLLIALGVTAATRLGYGLNRLSVGRNLQERFSAWRSAWLPQQGAPPAEQAQASTPPVAADPAAKPLVTADASVAPPPPAAITPVPATVPPSPRSAAAAPPLPPAPPASSVADTPPAPPAASAPAAPAAATAPATNESTENAAQTAPSVPPPAATKASGVTLRAKAPVWVEVRERKGRILLRRTLQAGETWSAPPNLDTDLLLSAGNVRNLELSINGTPQPLPTAKGGVLRDARIDNGA